ncbi:MAG: hypothetical protein HQ510_03295 [Candidatus Marinimicrobia bacterium]|nr:hypothetical protein [Candidatus Neomarinimicrobiota bacterium]
MSRNLILSIIIVFGLFFIVTGSEKQNIECTVTETQECWQFDNQKGWIYQAPEITITPSNSVETWSYDNEKGWIYQANEITVIG